MVIDLPPHVTDTVSFPLAVAYNGIFWKNINLSVYYFLVH